MVLDLNIIWHWSIFFSKESILITWRFGSGSVFFLGVRYGSRPEFGSRIWIQNPVYVFLNLFFIQWLDRKSLCFKLTNKPGFYKNSLYSSWTRRLQRIVVNSFRIIKRCGLQTGFRIRFFNEFGSESRSCFFSNEARSGYKTWSNPV